MDNGWIKIHRRICDHWVFAKPDYFKAWITIILTVNHEDKKVLIHGDIIECNRGQSILSLDSWTRLFGRGWSIQKVRTFFRLLQNDSMIAVEGLRKTTRLTVCNYDTYQDKQQANNRQITGSQQTDNNKQELKELKEDNIYADFDAFWNEYHRITRMPKSDKEAAIKKWNQLKKPEKDKAVQMIEIYYNHLPDKKYCKKARTYLNDKNFNDEFNVPVKDPMHYEPFNAAYKEIN